MFSFFIASAPEHFCMLFVHFSSLPRWCWWFEEAKEDIKTRRTILQWTRAHEFDALLNSLNRMLKQLRPSQQQMMMKMWNNVCAMWIYEISESNAIAGNQVIDISSLLFFYFQQFPFVCHRTALSSLAKLRQSRVGVDWSMAAVFHRCYKKSK